MTVTQNSDIRPAGLMDVPKIHVLLKPYIDAGILLPRREEDIYAALREFYVVPTPTGDDIAGCCALQIFSSDLGEVRSLAVAPSHLRQGLGRRIVAKIEDEARRIGLARLMALTYEVAFFERAGYHVVAMSELPEKVWGACINCRKFRNCDEIAVLKYL